jgi:hypothetical protein
MSMVSNDPPVDSPLMPKNLTMLAWNVIDPTGMTSITIPPEYYWYSNDYTIFGHETPMLTPW